MSRFAEIEAAMDKLPYRQQKRLLVLLTAGLHNGRAVRLKTRSGLKAATYPALEGLPHNLPTGTSDRVRQLACRKSRR